MHIHRNAQDVFPVADIVHNKNLHIDASYGRKLNLETSGYYTFLPGNQT